MNLVETPIHLMESQINNNNIFIKRDDLLPFSFGGNKLRIAEAYFNDMYSKGKNCIIAYGNSRSNLCRVIANLSKSKGVKCYIVSPTDDSGERYNTINRTISHLMDAEIIPCTKMNVAETISKVIKKSESEGYKPYYIYGNIYGAGNEVTPLRTYMKVYDELSKQAKNNKMNFDYIFLAVGTGTTIAGLTIRKMELKDDTNIVGISIARTKEKNDNVINNFISSYYSELNKNVSIQKDAFTIKDEWVLEGYGDYNDKLLKTIKDVLSFDGIALDPTYTGKAFWGMKEFIEKSNINHKNILFIHTGGTPLFFDNINLIRCENLSG